MSSRPSACATTEERPLHGERKKEGGGQAAVGHVLARGEQRLCFVDGLRKGFGHGKGPIFRDFLAACHPRFERFEACIGAGPGEE
jgi:hypothetical protein